MITEQEKKALLKEIHDSVVSFDEEACVRLCGKALREGIHPQEAIGDGLAAGMKTAGDLYEKGEYFVPELLLCSDALYLGLDILRPHIKHDPADQRAGKIILGVVQGDIHDIGKNLVKVMLIASGWDVLDLGNDVPCGRFVAANREFQADVIGLSSLMTSSMQAMPDIIRDIRAKYPGVKVVVGGAPMSKEIAEKYGADGYAPDAVAAVQEAERLISLSKGFEQNQWIG